MLTSRNTPCILATKKKRIAIFKAYANDLSATQTANLVGVNTKNRERLASNVSRTYEDHR